MIRHVASIGEIVDDVEAAVSFYRDVLGLPVKYEEGSGYAEVEVEGALHFGIWGRQHAAKATFGSPDATARIPLGFTIEFEVDEVAEASSAIKRKGWAIVQPPKKETWGQVTSRFFSPGGSLSGFAETPWRRQYTE